MFELLFFFVKIFLSVHLYCVDCASRNDSEVLFNIYIWKKSTCTCIVVFTDVCLEGGPTQVHLRAARGDLDPVQQQPPHAGFYIVAL